MAERKQVLIAGGGVAGLEAALALRDLAGDLVDITMISPEAEFSYRPMAVAEPFGRGHARKHPLAALTNRIGITLRRDALVSVEPGANVVVTAEGDRLSYDALIVAIGAESATAFPSATTWTPERDPEVFGGLLRDLEEGYTKSVAFVVPPANTWPLPAYELALMTAYDARGMGIDDVAITIYTPEAAPLANFGTAAGEGIRSDLDEAGVTIETGAYASEVDGRLTLLPDGTPLQAGRTVALPTAAGPRVAGLPSDRLGFVLTDQHGRVAHTPGVWAAGDAIAFPVKQGGLAAQQADAAAEAIAAWAGADVTPEPFRPVLRGVVLTGRGQRWLRHDPAQDPEGTTARHALFWPPTKVAGRYLSPFLAELDQAEELGDRLPQPDGRPVELDLEREIPAAADALRLARSRES
ncbi:MAG TPA: FAD-dependent oxidoreductase [Baekduia sp.]|uniref:NAD(P)/FAD-dependent oxidoreductase n=1 Tax=Baekduia sp. TaxID=2600305 RepID=UPI002D773E14|nr:FAD-dependent oxidoreductase [Baekduia sp.]HET6510266.1 FAD-dependent oxidoreductase [Baekduia sp.]